MLKTYGTIGMSLMVAIPPLFFMIVMALNIIGYLIAGIRYNNSLVTDGWTSLWRTYTCVNYPGTTGVFCGIKSEGAVVLGEAFLQACGDFRRYYNITQAIAVATIAFDGCAVLISLVLIGLYSAYSRRTLLTLGIILALIVLLLNAAVFVSYFLLLYHSCIGDVQGARLFVAPWCWLGAVAAAVAAMMSYALLPACDSEDKSGAPVVYGDSVRRVPLPPAPFDPTKDSGERLCPKDNCCIHNLRMPVSYVALPPNESIVPDEWAQREAIRRYEQADWLGTMEEWQAGIRHMDGRPVRTAVPQYNSLVQGM